MARYYILDGHEPKQVELVDMARWLKSHEHQVADEHIGDVRISTVFLGLDHNFEFGEGPPILFETEVLGGPLDGKMKRYSTWEEAEAGHKEMVNLVKNS